MPDANPIPRPGHGKLSGTFVGRFRIDALLGKGGMGEVYRAEDTVLKRTVAIKRVTRKLRSDQQVRHRVLREAQRASALTSEHIANIYDVFEHNNEVFLVMEYVEGRTLRQFLHEGALPFQTFLNLAIQAAEGLAAAHQKGIVHRDIKPENIMVTAEGVAKILDFGLAKRLSFVDEKGHTVSKQSSANNFAGTVGYIAPEVGLEQRLDARSDIFSLGVVFYEMLTGRHPFRLGSGHEGEPTVAERPPTADRVVPGIPPDVSRILKKMLAPNPADRYTTAADLLADLRIVQLSMSSATAQFVLGGRSRLRRPSKLALAVAVVSVTLAGLLWYRHRLQRNTSARQHPVRVVVADFEDRTGVADLGRTLNELLSTALEQSRLVTVFPDSRRSSVLKRMALDSNVRVDERIGREIAAREGLQAVVVGSVSHVGANFALVVRAVSPTGENLVSAEEVAPELNDLAPAIDRVAKKLRAGLGETADSLNQASLPLARVTSASLDAVRFYSTGKHLLYSDDARGATAFFRKAIELDRDFAMAYEYLGIAYWRMGDELHAREQLQQAMNHMDRVTDPEKQKILGDYAALTRDYDHAIEHFQMLAQLDPDDVSAYVNLGANYVAKFQYDKAISETQHAVELQPDPGPRANLANDYFLKGDTERALSLSNEIVSSNPDNLHAQRIRAYCLMKQGRDEEAKAKLEGALGDRGMRESEIRTILADIALAHGLVHEAVRQLKTAVVMDQESGNVPAAIGKKMLLAELTFVWPAAGEFKNQIEQVKEAQDPIILMRVGRAYARAGQLGDAKRLLRKLQQQTNAEPVPTMHSLALLLESEIAVREGRTQSAVETAEQALRYEDSIFVEEALAHVYREAGRATEAAREYEKVFARSNERIDSYDAPAFHQLIFDNYWLAVAYQQSGNTVAARQSLTKFLSYWSHPDAGSTIYADAIRRSNVIGAIPARAAGPPTPATYNTDSVTPSIPKSFSMSESLRAMVQNGANPNQVATRQKVWHRCPASASTTLYARGVRYFHMVRQKTAVMMNSAAALLHQVCPAQYLLALPRI